MKNTNIFIAIATMLMSLAINNNIFASAQSKLTYSVINSKMSDDVFEAELILTNEGNVDVLLAAYSFNLNLDKSMINGGDVTAEFVPGSKDIPSYIFEHRAVDYRNLPASLQVKMTTAFVSYFDAFHIGAHKSIILGHIRIVNTKAWNSVLNKPLIQAEPSEGIESSQVLAFVGTDGTVTTYYKSKNNLKTVIEALPRDNAVVRGSVPTTISLYPNPSYQDIAVNFVSELDADGMLALYNSLGQSVRNVNIKVIAGNNLHTVKVNDLPAGHYFLELRYSNKLSRHSFSVVK